jgi:hypothetical protein
MVCFIKFLLILMSRPISISLKKYIFHWAWLPKSTVSSPTYDESRYRLKTVKYYVYNSFDMLLQIDCHFSSRNTNWSISWQASNVHLQFSSTCRVLMNMKISYWIICTRKKMSTTQQAYYRHICLFYILWE